MVCIKLFEGSAPFEKCKGVPYKISIPKENFERAMLIDTKRNYSNNSDSDRSDGMEGILLSELADFESKKSFVIVLFTNNQREIPWKLVKCSEPEGRGQWKINSKAP